MIGRDILISTESLKGQIKDKAESLAIGAQAWKRSSVTKLVPFYEVLISLNLKCNALWDHEHSQEDKFVRLNGWGSPKVTRLGQPKGFCCFGLNIGKLEVTRAFSPGETCELFVVRGTTSFYNNKLQILPVGEGAVWNVRM